MIRAEVVIFIAAFSRLLVAQDIPIPAEEKIGICIIELTDERTLKAITFGYTGNQRSAQFIGDKPPIENMRIAGETIDSNEFSEPAEKVKHIGMASVVFRELSPKVQRQFELWRGS